MQWDGKAHSLEFSLGTFLPIVFWDDSVLYATNSRSSETSKSNNGTTGQRCAVVNIRQIRQTNYSEEFWIPGKIEWPGSDKKPLH